jgi:Ca2+-dependent lipid-binding protein
VLVSLDLQVFDEDNMKQDKRLGIAKLPLSDLEMETVQEVNLQLLSSLDTTKVKDKKDRGMLSIKAGSISLVLFRVQLAAATSPRLPDVPFCKLLLQVVYHQFTNAEAREALELEKQTVEERRKVKSETAAVSGAADGASSGTASTVTHVAGTGVAAAGTGDSRAGSSGGMGIGAVGSGIGAFGSGLHKAGKSAGKFVGRTVTGPFSSARRSASNVPNVVDE